MSTQETEMKVTVRTTDGVSSEHIYTFDGPLSEYDRESVRELRKLIVNAVEGNEPGFLRLDNPMAWYRSPHLVSVTVTLTREADRIPVDELRQLGLM